MKIQELMEEFGVRKTPGILVMSDANEDGFRWLSDGWFAENIRDQQFSQNLMDMAQRCIADGKDVEDVIRLLGEAGFVVKPAIGSGVEA